MTTNRTNPNLGGRAASQLFVLMAVATTSLDLAPARAGGDLAAQVNACIEAARAGQDIPGAAVAVLEDGRFVHDQGYGVKHRESGGAVGAGTLFRAGSVQKMMTAAAVLAQQDRGLLGVDEPVTALIPELRFAGRWRADQVTIEHLLTHTAAVPNLSETSCSTDDAALSDWASTLADVQLYAPPGSFWNYSNAGYSLAGLVAERAAGVPYRQLMRESVWGPAGMASTFAGAADAVVHGNYTFGHSTDSDGGSVIYAPDAYDCGWASPPGNAFTTAGDLARFAATLMDDGGAVLAPESAAELVAPHVSMQELPGRDYGYGVIVEDWDGVRVLAHDGRNLGWSSYLVFVPEKKTAVAVLANADADLGAAAECALTAATGLARPPYPDLTTEPATWSRYEGVYRVLDEGGDIFPMAVTLDGDELRATVVDVETGEVTELPARQLYLDTFFIDIDGDGAPSSSLEVVTFIETTSPAGGRTMWLRNRSYVGERAARVRERADGGRRLEELVR